MGGRTRWISSLPAALFTALLLLTAASGIPGFRRVASSREPQDSPGGSEDRRAHSQEESAPSARPHSAAARGLVVMMWLLLPACAILPLAPGWRRVRRKALATAALAAAVCGVGLLTLLASFTGFLVGKGVPVSAGPEGASYTRMMALHVLGIPILLGLALCLPGALQILVTRPRHLRSHEEPSDTGLGPRPAGN